MPLAETFGYATDIRSMSQGQSTFTKERACFRKVPASVKEDFVADKKKQLVGAVTSAANTIRRQGDGFA